MKELLVLKMNKFKYFKDKEDEINILEKSFANQIKDLLIGKIFVSGNENLKKQTNCF